VKEAEYKAVVYIKGGGVIRQSRFLVNNAIITGRNVADYLKGFHISEMMLIFTFYVENNWKNGK
jgi:hypothetical protein